MGSCPGGECLVALSAAMAAQLAAGREEDQLVVMAAFLTSLADNLALITAQRAACAAKNPCGKPETGVKYGHNPLQEVL